ncbi:hypothetical protein QYE76_058698 [Lolium multiflorum]|uniref:Uncharacterized protein n=1 Tax=Lolium multiflorum TaxID=4521 RepID=A0AAD8WPX2_LOLMU|nr:hypothetical protein QYE76_058698 [Lolium multiflorum]
MIKEGETIAEAYGRLGALRVKVKGLGCDKYNDGFEMNEEFIKSKVIAMIAVKQKDTNLALNLRILTKQADLSADDLVSYVAANDNMAKEGERLMVMNRADGPSHNLALKARAVHESEEVYEIEEEEEMTSTSDIGTDFAFFVKKYKKKFPISSNEKKRTCYNCDEDNHFANECPYEKRVDKPRFVKGVKPRLKPNPINERYKKNKGRAFVGTEYISDDEGEDEEKEAGMAGLAFSEPGSLFTYDYSKDYSTESSTPKVIGSSFMARMTCDDSDDSSSSTVVGSCLMAREAKVMESPPSLSSILDDDNTDNLDEDDVLKGLFKVRCTLRGDALVKFDFLMDSLNQRDESIEELESHIENEKRRFNLLRQELKNERCISQGLKQLVETFELDKAKDLETIERAQLMAQELEDSKKELEVAHASLTKDLNHLEKANKLVKDELKKLGENHDLLQDTYKKALGSLSDPLLLTKELAKFTTSKNKMGLDDLLSKQRSNNKKYGLGYVPKPHKKNNYKKEKPAQKKNKKLHGKQLKKRHPINNIVTTSGPLELLHLDLFGPSHYDTLGGSKYGLVIVDDYSRYSWVFLLKSKDETYKEFIIFAKKAQRMYEAEIKVIRTDNGTKFKNYTMQEFVDDEGIKHEFSAPYTPQQNEKLGKFETRTIEGIFVGYAENSHAYRYFNKSSRTIEVSCDVVFLEDNGSQVEQVVPCAAGDADPSNAIKLMGIGHIRLVEKKPQVQPKWSLAQLKLNHQVQPKIHLPLKMSRIPKNKKKTLILLSKTKMMIKNHPHPIVKLKLPLMINFEPLKVHEALVDPDWVIAMQEELECFTRNEVWSLVERPKDHRINVIGTKWVFKNKQDENGIVIRNKARLVAQGFAQIEGGSSDGNQGVAKRGKNERPPGCRTSTRVPSKAAQSSGPVSSAGGRIKTTGKKRKGKDAAQNDDLVEQQPNYNTGTVQIAGWRRLREENPYRFKERTYTGGDREFWTKTQACF